MTPLGFFMIGFVLFALGAIWGALAGWQGIGWAILLTAGFLLMLWGGMVRI